ncbi:hypothetical protein [Aeromonas hydrophila]|nr:hypothetical protein [Aeromonas hydrophila]
MANSSKSEPQAIKFLDDNCPMWRQANPPSAGKVEVIDEEA